MAQVGIIIGSESDWPTLRDAAVILDELGVTHEARIISAHRTPDRLWDYGTTAVARGLQVIIAGAGGAAHLPGMMASKTRLPVIGVPVATKALGGIDSLYSIVQMPRGFPVATMAIGGAANAGLMAAAILALRDPGLADRLDAWRSDLSASIPDVPAMAEALPPGAVIGILGGGQLGRMLAVAASRLGLRAHVFDPDAASPAGEVACRLTTAAYDDAPALRAFAASVDVITYEFENIPTAALDLIEALRPIRPGRRALATSQDRLTEKRFLQDLGLQTAPFAQVDDAAGLAQALDLIGAPAILKTRRLGYDGKGQARILSAADAAPALAALSGAPALLEGVVAFDREVSVIGARGLDGSIACYDPGENLHKAGILRTTTVPARLSPGQRSDAVLIAARILNALDYVGVIGVELFVTASGLIVNEFAPRVHNSGHWTQNGCAICQFEQHIRAIAGWPLGDGSRHSNVTMENLIGDDMQQLAMLARTNAALHLYGKSKITPSRKMGHVNRITGPA